MARMIPQPMHPDTQSSAERRLYAEFQNQLPDDFVVFHSVWWQLRDRVTGIRDGEADFVIAHPDYGILILEVKGGRIRYDGRTGEWFSNQYQIKDPFKQGRAAKYSLLEKLKELPYWRNRWITMGYAVAFPDVAVKGDLRLDAPRELILDASDLADLDTWVDRALRYLHGRGPDDNPLGVAGVSELIDLLSPSWDLAPLVIRGNPGRGTRTGPPDRGTVHHARFPGAPPAGGHQRLCRFGQDHTGCRKGQTPGQAGLSSAAHLFQRQSGRIPQRG